MMKPRRIMPLLCLLAAAAVADESQVELGAELYGEYCSGCHGDDVAGLQNFSDDFARFTSRLEGETEDMSDFTDFFEPEEVAGMFAFLQSVVSAKGESP